MAAGGAESANEATKEGAAVAEFKGPWTQWVRVSPRNGSCVRLRPEHRDHVWSYDFVHCRTDDGKAFRTLNILDEFTRECLTIRVKRKLNSVEVIDALSDLFILRGVPRFIRSELPMDAPLVRAPLATARN